MSHGWVISRRLSTFDLNHYHRSPDGRLLVISSSDGFCSVVHFEDNELGIPLINQFEDKENSSPLVTVLYSVQKQILMESNQDIPCDPSVEKIDSNKLEKSANSDIEMVDAVHQTPSLNNGTEPGPKKGKRITPTFIRSL
jgi:hypothetical protein